MAVRAVHKKFKVHSLTGRITDKLMGEAFKAVRKNKGVAGVDQVSVGMFEDNLEQNLGALMRDLKRRTFEPKPLKRVRIPKGKGQTRPLGIPAVRDRVAQEVVRRLLDPIFEPLFHDNSFGFRKGRNCHQAVERVKALHRQGLCWVVDADIKGFFDDISHKLIDDFVAAEVADGNVLGLINKFLRCGVLEDGWVKPTPKGVPQGGVVSPLLANAVLNYLDWQLDAAGCRFVRYADDFVVMCTSRAEAEKALDLVRKLVEVDLELTLHPEKTRIVHMKDGFDFLGFRIGSYSIKARDKSVENFKMKVRGLTIRSHNLDSEVIEKLNRVISGTVRYFATRFSRTLDQFTRLDDWIRRRIRCMKYKRISQHDNKRLRNRHIERLGLLSCRAVCLAAQGRRIPSPSGAISRGSPGA
jgi:group II intron reverse transcriptase/maturase